MEQIKINYPDVNSRVTSLNSKVLTEIREREANSNQILSVLNRVDGEKPFSTSAAETENKISVQRFAEVYKKLCSFISNSSVTIEEEEMRIANTFTAGIK